MYKFRKNMNLIFKVLCFLATLLSIFILIVLLYHVAKEGFEYLNLDFLLNTPSRKAALSGIKVALIGSTYVIFLTALFSIPVGVMTALFLEEYLPKRKLYKFFVINIGNLAGMPSIIYGLLGLSIFVRYFSFDRSIISGALTSSLLILPIIIISAQQAFKAVPLTLREAAQALGAKKYQVIFGHVLPASIPGIMTGVILSLSRAIGETAPLIIVGALSYVAVVPTSLKDPYTVLPIQIYNWISRPQAEFHSIAASAIIVLVILLLLLNSSAILIREKFQRYKQ